MKNNWQKWILSVAVLLAIFPCAPCCSAQELPDEVGQWQQYVNLIRRNTLDLRTNEPFLLRVDYELYDLDGKLSGKGTAEEAWGTSGDRITIKSQTLTVEEPSEPEVWVRTHTRESYLVHQVLKSYIHPLDTSAKKAAFAFDRFQPVNDVALGDCFALGLFSARTPTAMTYCTDHENRISTVTGQLFVLRRSEFLRYRDREVPSNVEVVYEGKVAITSHLTTLNTIPPENYENSTSATLPDPLVRGDHIAAAALNKPQPIYPKQAKKKRITGSVLLSAIITKDGTITGLDVVASPNPLLSASALEAVSTWTYKPYLLDGKPTALDTAITVNYALGP